MFGRIVAGNREGCSRYEYPCPRQPEGFTARTRPRSSSDHRIGTSCAYPFVRYSGRGTACADLPSRSGQMAPDGRSHRTYLVFLEAAGALVELPEVSPAVVSHPDDDPILQTAIVGRADVLCTRDGVFRFARRAAPPLHGARGHGQAARSHDRGLDGFAGIL